MATINRPIPGVMFGLTHSPDGGLLIREPKVLKVGIGLPKGPAINVWIANTPDGPRWKVQLGYNKDAQVATFKERAAAEAKYWEKLPTAPVCPYPRKIGYFTFTKPIVNAAGQEQYVADFDAIESAGPTPTEIDIVLLDDEPFTGAYQMWSSSELLCKGDGINAMRLVKLAETSDEKAVAQECAASGEKYFPLEGCWTGDCPYSKETVKNGKPQPSACKPGGDLKFQLASNIRVGGTAYFHTTGFRSISSIFSSLHRISTLTGGRLSGIPLKMVLRPFRTNHNGQPATQHAVSLEFRASDIPTLRKKLLESLFEFRQIAGVEAPQRSVRLIEASATEPAGDGEDDGPAISAAAMAAEFYPEADGDEQTETQDPPSAPAAADAAAASRGKTAELASRLRAAKGGTAAAPPEAVAAPAPAPNPAPVPAPEPHVEGPGVIPEDVF